MQLIKLLKRIGRFTITPFKRKQPNEKNSKLKVLLKKDGNTYYTFKDKPLAYRFLIGMMNVKYAEMGIDAQSALEYLEEIIKALNSNKPAEAAYSAHKFKQRIVAADPEMAYMQLATVYVLMNNEDATDYSTELAKEKISIWNKDKELKSFFLNIAYQIIKGQQQTLSKTMLDVSVGLAKTIING